MRFTSRISTSTMTSALALSTMSMRRAAAAILSGVSFMVRALEPTTGATRRAPSTRRRRSTVSFRSAFERKKVFTTCCSYSRRLEAVSGTTITTCESTTRWKVWAMLPRALRAWSKGTSRRSRLTGWSRNSGSKTKLTPAVRPSEQVDLAQARVAEGDAERLLGPRAEDEPGQAPLPRAVLQLVHGGRGSPRRALLLRLLDLTPQGGRGRVQVARQPELVERLLEEAAAEEASPARGVLLGGAELRALEALPIGEAVGVLLERLRVLEDGAVVVLPPLGVLAGAEGGRGGAAQEGGQGEREGGRAPAHPVTTSTPRGISKSKIRSFSPTFSRIWSNSNALRLPCASRTRMPRMRAVSSTST